ncbi:MAG: hypothetical protein NDJ90_10835 [Oligoflexia bacterium]|nr:hypothetical protein [Oligoflexia bacterium]
MACLPRVGWAFGFPLDPSQFSDPTVLLGADVAPRLIKAIGLATDHRGYEPATAYGTQGVDIGLEGTMVKLPDAFTEALAAAGTTGGENLPFLPVPRLNIHKGFARQLDLGFSIFWTTSFRLYGYEAKVIIAEPEEGPTFALRLSLTHSNFKAGNGVTLQLLTNTVTPSLLVSRRLAFADPYLGVGYQYAIGKALLTVPVSTPAPVYKMSGRGGGFLAFTGLALRLPGMGFKLSVEGAYSSAGASMLGGKFGLSF